MILDTIIKSLESASPVEQYVIWTDSFKKEAIILLIIYFYINSKSNVNNYGLRLKID
jgi:hypothetical protein